MRPALTLLITLVPLALSSPSPADESALGAVPPLGYGDSVSNSTAPVPRSLIARHPAPGSDDGFFAVGLMLPRGWEEPAQKRDGAVDPRGAVERWEGFPLERSTEGEVKVPASYEEAKRMRRADQGRKEGKRGLLKSLIRLTWYSGEDLKNPACGDWRLGGKWSPNNGNMICALTASWTDKNGDKPQCNDFIKLTTKSNKSIIVRVIDACAGSAMSPENSCTKGMKVADLSMSAFKKLASLNQGIIDGVTVEIVAKPGGKKWTAADTKLYGPEKY